VTVGVSNCDRSKVDDGQEPMAEDASHTSLVEPTAKHEGNSVSCNQYQSEGCVGVDNGPLAALRPADFVAILSECFVQTLNLSFIRESTIVVCDIVEGGVLITMRRCVVLHRVVKVVLDDEHISPLLELHRAEDKRTDKSDKSSCKNAEFLPDRLPAHA